MEPFLGPSTRTARALLSTLWTLLATGWEMVVWGNVRAGSVSLQGQPRSFRLLIRIGLWLVILLLLTLLIADTWRVVSPLIPLVAETDSLSGLYAPQLLVSLTIGLLALAWAYVVTGSLHAPGWARAVVLALLALFDAGLSLTLLTDSLSDVGLIATGNYNALWGPAMLITHVLGWLALLAWALWRWRRPARPGLEFAVTLLLTIVIVFSSHFAALLGNATFQSETMASALQLTNTLEAVGVFLTPFILISGAEVAEFGMTLTEEVTGRLAQNALAAKKWARRAWVAGLIVFLLWRLAAQWVGPLLTRSFALGWGAVIAALAALALLALRRGRPPVGELPGWVVPVAAVTLYAVLVVVEIVGFAEALLATVTLLFGQGPSAIMALTNQFFRLLSRGNEVVVGSAALLFGTFLWLRALVRRQSLPAAALYAWLFGAWLIFWILTRPGALLGSLAFHYTDLETIMAPILLALLLAAALFRKLGPRTLLHLTAAALLLWLLESQSWLSDPLSPIEGLFGAPAIFISAGILLNVLSAGNHFAHNTEDAGFPRLSRALLYFGYALMTVTTINWLAATHAAGAIAQNNQIAQNGFIAIGLPLAIFALVTGSDELLGSQESVENETTRGAEANG